MKPKAARPRRAAAGKRPKTKKEDIMKRIIGLSYILVLISLMGCQSSDSETVGSENQGADLADSLAAPRYAIVKTSNTKLRVTPDLQGEVLAVLSLGNTLIYLEDSTRFKTPLSIGGQMESHSWYKFRDHKTEKEGWVYGGTLRFLTDEENQQAAVLLNRGESSQALLQQKAKKEVQEEYLKVYQQYLVGLDAKQIEHVSLAIRAYEERLAPANGLTRDAAFGLYRSFFFRVLSQQQGRSWTGYEYLREEIQQHGQADLDAYEATRYLARNGFTFKLKDGRIVLAEDMDFTLKHFYRLVSPVMRHYLNVKQMDIDDPLLNDKGQVNLELLSLVDRLVDWEELQLRIGEDFLWYEEVKQQIQAHNQALVRLLVADAKLWPKLCKHMEKQHQEAPLFTRIQNLRQRFPEGERQPEGSDFQALNLRS